MKKRFSYTLAAMLLPMGGLVPAAVDAGPASPAINGKSHFAKFGTNRVHYIVTGRGKHTLVLVHCWAGNLGLWREQVPALADKARLILIDLPGHGKSDKPHAAYTMDFFAEAVLSVMQDANVRQATLVGHSMGVPVICRVYKRAPERVAALVPVDGTLRRPKMSAEQAEQFLAGFRAPDYRQKTREFLGTMFPAPGTEALRDKVIAELFETPDYVMLGAMEGMFGPSQPDWDLQHVAVPVLAIHAPNPMWTEEYQQYLRSLSSKTEFHIIQGTGHWLMLEKPVEFNALLTELLRRNELIDK